MPFHVLIFENYEITVMGVQETEHLSNVVESDGLVLILGHQR